MDANFAPTFLGGYAALMTEREQEAFAKLVGVCRRLRGPDGCPWDRAQTLESMTPYITEEAVESGEAIAEGDPEKIAEELGLPNGTIASRISRCLTRLRRELEGREAPLPTSGRMR